MTAHLIGWEIPWTDRTERNDMTNEKFVRQAYALAEVNDIPGWVGCFNPDGVFVDESVGVTYRGPSEVARPVENYGTAFSDMHREIYEVYVSGDVVVVELALQGTHAGRSGFPRGSFHRRVTGWTRPAAMSSSSRTAGSRCSIVTSLER
jgi:ketosteroid isomerase-like protein